MISAIIPCYNNFKTIERAVLSLLYQTYPVKEIIIVDDGSDLKTKTILEDLKKKSDKIKVITQENKGVSIARNVAIQKCSEDYVVTLDADDYYENEFLEKALQVINNDVNSAAVICGYNMVDEDGIVQSSYIPPKVNLARCLVSNGILSCALFKKEILTEVGLYDPLLVDGYEDWDLNIRILNAGYTFEVIPEFLFNYTDTHNSRNDRAILLDKKLRDILFEKYRTLYQDHTEYFLGYLVEKERFYKQELEKIKSSKSFKLGNFVMSTIRKIKNIVLFWKN